MKYGAINWPLSVRLSRVLLTPNSVWYLLRILSKILKSYVIDPKSSLLWEDWGLFVEKSMATTQLYISFLSVCLFDLLCFPFKVLTCFYIFSYIKH